MLEYVSCAGRHVRSLSSEASVVVSRVPLSPRDLLVCYLHKTSPTPISVLYHYGLNEAFFLAFTHLAITATVRTVHTDITYIPQHRYN